VRQLSALQITVAAALMLTTWLALRAWGALAGGLPAGLAREAEPLLWNTATVTQLVYMAFVATVVTFLLWTWGQARMPATHAAVIFSLEPVFATLFAILLRGSAEWSGGRSTLGAGLVIAGVIVSELRWGRREVEAEVNETEWEGHEAVED
jgi:drug/metabolite transporter (DMT)-like permease